MELADGSTDVVHPEVRAHINSLASALGGFEDGQYRLGDDAYEVLRDLKKWIRFYDEKTNRMDVARCIAEANLIDGDLLHILASWPENAMDNKFRARMALACLEIMVPLTWPMERDPERTTINHHRHMPVLQLAQVAYKRAIINFDGARILHTAVRVALPSMAMSIGDRSARDQGIIKLMLFFLRNVAMIEPPPNVAYEGDESQISRSATIDAFSYQDIFMVLLTICSNMGEDFRTEDVAVMEIIYHLVKRVDVSQLFMSEQQLNKTKAQELATMMSKETAMLKAYNRNGPTRHNRFGTMLWVKRDGGKMSAVSGQGALADPASRQQKMDDSKTFRPPRKARRKDVEVETRDLGAPPKLNARANDQLKGFVEEFLDSGFNPLFEHVRKSIDREASHVLSYHRRQYMYLVAWFLETERARRASRARSKPAASVEEVSSFNLVAGVLNQSMFITISRTMSEAWEHKDWPELTAVMKCFTQILLTVQEMYESPLDEDQEIAENTLSRLFYEETTHDLIANVMRQYKDQGFDYLDAATELTHHYLRILEAYSKQNVDMQVRSRRRTRRTKKKADAAAGVVEGAVVNPEEDDSADDAQQAEQTSKERRFDFQRFCVRFTPQGVVDTFVAFTKFYKDLNDAQLKRAHRYFYRLAFKQDMSVMLFRVDIIHLLHGMIKGPEPLSRTSGMFKEWEELSKQVLRKCFKKIEERPVLLIEMLFSKIPATAHYLEYGFEKQTLSTTTPKPAAELEFKYTEDREQQIAIVVGVLLDKSQADHITWVKTALTQAEEERRVLQAADTAISSVENPEEEGAAAVEGEKPPPSYLPFTVLPDNDARQTAMFKNGHLRLLMKLSGMQKLGVTAEETPQTMWVFPAEVTPDDMKDTLELINKAEFSPPTYEEGVLAEHQLRRKTVSRKKASFDDEDDGDDGDVEALFPAGGPTERKVVDGKKKKKLTRRRRRKDEEGSGAEQEPEDEAAAERAQRRREKELEKAAKIKSQLYVTVSDDESDEERDKEFFAREEAQRRQQAKVTEGAAPVAVPVKGKGRKKKAEPVLLALDGDDDDLLATTLTWRVEESGSDSDSGGEDTPASSPRASSEGSARGKRKGVEDEGNGVDVTMADEDEEEVVGVSRVRKRQRVKGGFVDSSDEE
ncbi:topoisomerase 1-associated factor 1 [Plectosphaerella plurivora]|uniref:Topoisomerase 1-associated factor 1 n=1 Tax=Plectosphaerella plurivora TaxID=936078 RepID=A0A9P9A819_9PEZI|nr:topoisomerase 1-associated factor 1 [Plectosphaerella plurivora]